MNQEQAVEFVPLLNFENDYEILNAFPFTIRRKRDHYQIKENDRGNGYIRVHLNQHDFYKHVLIAKQFIPNPLNLPEIDHINHDRADYHIENLRWVSHSENNKNRSSTKGVEYNFVDEIDEDSIIVTDYGKYEFEEYYYDETVDKFYFWNGVQFRELHVNEMKNGSKYVIMNDINGSKVKVMISKFKKLYGLV